MNERHGCELPAEVDPLVIASFLAGEKRQVWALRRDTHEPVFLSEGHAESMRSFTKQKLKCLYPDCTAQLTTKGGTKRAHFAHVNTVEHETGWESEAHLAGKAMLVRWLTDRLCVGEPPHPDVRAEQTVKDPATRTHRRPDVLVTGRSGQRVAFEVEYKGWAIEAWRAKQSDLDATGIRCLWLIGHTRLRLLEVSDLGARVRLPALAMDMARAGKPLLVINPSTQQIGTLAQTSSFDGRYKGASREAWLRVDALSDCDFSPLGGVATPTLRAIAAAENEARRAEQAERARAAAFDEAQRKKAEQYAEWRRESAARRAKRGQIEQEAWDESELKADLLSRYRTVPVELDEDTGGPPGLAATRLHWHTAIYEDLVHLRTQAFSVDDVWATLTRHKIRRYGFKSDSLKQVTRWLDHLANLRLLRYETTPGGPARYRPTGRAIEDVRADRAAAAEQKAAADRKKAEREARSRAAVSAELRGEGKRRFPWEPEPVGATPGPTLATPHQEVELPSSLSRFRAIPAIARPTRNDTVFGIEPSLWKAAIFAGCVADRGNWSTFGERDIRTAMGRHGVAEYGNWSSRQLDAVRGFLEALEAEGWIFIVSPKEFAASGKSWASDPRPGGAT